MIQFSCWTPEHRARCGSHSLKLLCWWKCITNKQAGELQANAPGLPWLEKNTNKQNHISWRKVQNKRKSEWNSHVYRDKTVTPFHALQSGHLYLHLQKILGLWRSAHLQKNTNQPVSIMRSLVDRPALWFASTDTPKEPAKWSWTTLPHWVYNQPVIVSEVGILQLQSHLLLLNHLTVAPINRHQKLNIKRYFYKGS